MNILMILAVAVAGGVGACIRYVAVEGWPRMREPEPAVAENDPAATLVAAPSRRLAPEWRLMIVNVLASRHRELAFAGRAAHRRRRALECRWCLEARIQDR